MNRPLIPGHMRAHTWVECLVFGIATFVFTGSVISVGGMLLLVLGMFFANQATHLGQENHKGLQMTWIEEQMQGYRWPFVVLSFAVSLPGLFLLAGKY